MGFKFGYSTLRWQHPDFEALLTQLKDAGWDGWEMRQSLDWVGTPQRIRQVCNNVDLPIAAVTARGLPIDKNPEQMELNKRRIDFAAEVEADCFMFMGAGKPRIAQSIVPTSQHSLMFPKTGRNTPRNTVWMFVTISTQTPPLIRLTTGRNI